MVGLDSFFGSKRNVVQENVHERKQQASSKSEERELERENLNPDKLPPYAGEGPETDKIKKQSVKLVFHSEETLEKFKRHFRVANYIEPSVTNIDLLEALLEELESGRIQYDKKEKCITYNNG